MDANINKFYIEVALHNVLSHQLRNMTTYMYSYSLIII